jgi:hypothetical protein
MILNSYAVLDFFTCLLRFAFGLMILSLGTTAWCKCRPGLTPEGRKALEDRCYLLFLAALVLLGLNLASWPLLYLLLQSYVPEWPGVMCIYGVTQIGAGSIGVSRFLPGLLGILQASKPALVVASGAWFAIYLINRRTRTAPLLRRLLGVLLAVGLLASADAALEAAYLIIPKKEEFLSAGCCTEVFDRAGAAPTLLEMFGGDAVRLPLFVAYYGVNLGMLLTLGAYTRRGGEAWTTPSLVPLLLGAGLVFLVNSVFLIEVASPEVLHLPYHHCPYDLVPKAPEMVVGVALYAWGSFSVGWAFVLSWLANCEESRPFLWEAVRKVLIMSLLCYAGSLGMFSTELALA